MECDNCGTGIDENMDTIVTSDIVSGNFCTESCKCQAEDRAL